MAIRASSQTTLIDLTDGYSVVLTNEAHTFFGTQNSVDGTQVTTTTIQALQGPNDVNCSVDKFTGLPAGLSIVSDGKKPRPTLTITATTALTKDGSVVIPVIIDGEGITINKVFSWSIAFKGSTGPKGDSIKVTGQQLLYVKSSNGTSIPGSDAGWSSTIPATVAGEYLWTKTIVSYSDGKSSTSYSVGSHGQTGPQGDKGNPGTSVTISSKEVAYAVSTSGTTAPGSGWQKDKVPNVPQTQFLWTRTTVNYSNGQQTVAYSVARQGEKGDTGAAGKDAYTLTVTSSGGTIFKNTAINTTLTAHVFKGGVEIPSSEISKHGTIKWYKDGATSTNITGQTLTISAGDVNEKATYVTTLE